MEPSVLYRPGRHPQDLEDVSLEFVEDSVGRHDWRTNWPKWKANQGDEAGVKRGVQKWLDYMGIEFDPVDIIVYLDDMIKNRNGRWR